MGQKQNNETSDAAGVSLTGLYVISIKAMAIGVAMVFALNLATPTDFIFEQFADLKTEIGVFYWLAVVRRLLGLSLVIVAIGMPSLVLMHGLLRPVSHCLERMKGALETEPLKIEQARRRIINLPFIFIAIHVSVWVVLPLLIFLMSYLVHWMDMRTAVVFSIRASMVGFITSTVAFYRIEDYCRKGLVPWFFPRGNLAGRNGAARFGK